MSEREGLYCKKHERWCPTGVCDYCEPALPRAPIVLGGAHPVSMRGLNAILPPPIFWRIGLRPCDHANGYCKDTAHKYELPEDPLAVLAEQIEQRMDDTDARMRTLQLYGADPEE